MSLEDAARLHTLERQLESVQREILAQKLNISLLEGKPHNEARTHQAKCDLERMEESRTDLWMQIARLHNKRQEGKPCT